VDIRPARPADSGQIATIWYEGWRDGHLGHVPNALLPYRTHESFVERAAGRIADTAVGGVDDEVAGFVMVVDDEVEQVYVSARHRGTGSAGALLAEAERLVAAHGHDRAWRAVATPMPALPPITTMVCPSSSGPRVGTPVTVVSAMDPPSGASPRR